MWSDLLNNNLPVNAVNRIYYAVHACAKIMVNLENSNPKTHQGVISEFGRLYVKTSKIDIEYSQILQRLYSLREQVDYELHTSLHQDEVELLFEQGQKFVSMVEKFVLL